MKREIKTAENKTTSEYKKKSTRGIEKNVKKGRGHKEQEQHNRRKRP